MVIRRSCTMEIEEYDVSSYIIIDYYHSLLPGTKATIRVYPAENHYQIADMYPGKWFCVYTVDGDNNYIMDYVNELHKGASHFVSAVEAALYAILDLKQHIAELERLEYMRNLQEVLRKREIDKSPA
jgi:hypothetical protein